jgi:hypothetical protein
MLVGTDLQRSVANMTLGLHKAISTRAHRADAYRLGEKEWQVQYEFSGNVGTATQETLITMNFEPVFSRDAGMVRTSTLDRPLAHLSVELLTAPALVMPYAYISGWLLDDDGDYNGAVATAGMHWPTPVAGVATAFDAILHARFQGYGAIWDPDGPYDGGASIDDMETVT